MKKAKTKTHRNAVKTLTYAYIRKIKKWMFCPACQNGKMTINKKSTLWICEDCGYMLSADEFEDDYVFWFCDECNAYLNNQDGFDRHSTRHTCQKCGYENDTTFDNVKGICSDCGKIIPDPDATLCVDCKRVRKDKAKEWLKTAGKVVGVAAAVAGTVYLAAQSSGDDEERDYNYLPDGDEDGGGITVKKSWLKSASEDELRARKAEITADTDWRSGSILDGDFDAEIEALDAIDEEINQRSWDRYNSEDHSNESYGVHREHGWYLPNDD